MRVESLPQRLKRESHLLYQLAQFRFAQINSRSTYIRYLIQSHHYVVAAVPLMKFALSTDYAAADPVFRQYLTGHIEEEAGHDRWIVNDLGELGVREEVLAQQPPFAETCQMAGAAYYGIAHRHPVSILGYIYALESAPVTADFLDDMARRCDVPRSAMFTLSEHGAHDVDHSADAAAMIERYQGQERVELAIRDASLMALSSFVSLLKAVIEAPQPEPQEAAR